MLRQWLSHPALWQPRYLALRVQGTQACHGLTAGASFVLPIRLLVESGMLTTPAAPILGYPWQPVLGLHAVLRYKYILLTGGPDFVLCDQVDHLPSRHKQLVSEELAIGYCALVLRDSFDVRHIADAETVLGTQLQRVVAAGRQCPDFFGLDGSEGVVIAEAKGTMGNMRSLAPKLRKGMRQVQAVQPIQLPLRWRVVAGLALMQQKTGRPSIGAVWDPPEEEPVPVEVSSVAIVRQAYAKVFSFVGLPYHAMYLLGVSIDERMLQEERDSLTRIDQIHDAEVILFQTTENMVGMVRSVYDLLMTSQTERLQERLRETLGRVEAREDDMMIILNNGVVVVRG